MKRLAIRLGIGAVATGAGVCLSAALTGCGTLALQDLLGENTCLILNCDTLFFLDEVEHEDMEAMDTSDDHDDMDMDGDHDMDAMDTSDDHDDMDMDGDEHNDDGGGQLAVECPDLGLTPAKASEWVDFVNWDEATRVEMMAHETSEDLFHFMPDHLEFEAGKPYILVMQSSADNQEKHYFHAPDFYKAIATRKAQTANAEYKAPYFDDFELKVNGELELYFVPVIEGEYQMWCTVPGHRDKGMEGEFHIVCGDGLALELEVDPDFETALGSDDRRSGSNLVWESAQELTVTMDEISFEEGSEELAFHPADLTLDANTAYKLTIHNPADNASKHYYTAADFYQTTVTRKAEDSNAEIKVPYFKAIEVLIGGSTELFIVPTVPGVYDVICTITDHADFGMTGTITVE